MKARRVCLCVLSLAALLAPSGGGASQIIGWTNDEIDAWADAISDAFSFAWYSGDDQCAEMLGASGAGWNSEGLRAKWDPKYPRGGYNFTHHVIMIEPGQTPEATVHAVVHEGIHAAYPDGHRIHARIDDYADLYPVVRMCAESYFPM